MKDVSLEVPNAPQVFLERRSRRSRSSSHNHARRASADGLYESVLTVTVTAKAGDKTCFLVEAAQAGIFQIRNVPEADLEPSSASPARTSSSPTRARRSPT